METLLAQRRSEYADIIYLSFPGDEKALGGCLASGRGFFHIGPDGSAEPCPFSPFSDSNVAEMGVREALKSPPPCSARFVLPRHSDGSIQADVRCLNIVRKSKKWSYNQSLKSI